MARKKKIPRLKVLRPEYYAQRVKDLEYYVSRSDLDAFLICKSLGFNQRWIYNITSGRRNKRPSDQRISVIIEFIKDYERLQTYYLALANQIPRRKNNERRPL